MDCAICHVGRTAPGLATVTLEAGESIVIIKQVPADICDTCGEYYLDEATSEAVLESARRAAEAGAEVQILRFAA